jgi:hypothetical protein
MKTDLHSGTNTLADIPSAAKVAPGSDSKLRLAAFAVVVMAGLIRVWVGRYSMNPDGICYLDLGDAFFRRKWFDVVNGYWSPLYAWLLGAGLFVAKPSHWWEFPVAHAVNFVIYLAAFVACEFFLRSLLQQQRRESHPEDNAQPLSESYLLAIGYSLFLWTSLELIPIWDLSPDMLVAAFVYLIAGLLLRIRFHSSVPLFIALGAALGFAYLAKAVMFPLAFAFILIGLFCVPRGKRLLYVSLVSSTFLAVSAPWLAALSHAKGRLDFGDSGHLSYSALVNPGGRLLNWQGERPGSGVPVHATRKIHDNPPVYEFATPIGGTYPPAYDPSYWDEGRKSIFDLRRQLRVIKEHLLLYAELLLRNQSGLLAGVLAFVLAGGASSRKAISGNWPLFLMFLAAAGLYALVHVEPRFIGAYVTIFWMAILCGIRLSGAETRRMAEYVALAIVVTILLSVADGTMRAIRAGGPYSARDQIVVADEIEKMGLHAGDHIAILGDGNWAYWARLGKLKIVSTVVSINTPAFWAETPAEREDVYRLLAGTGARAVVSAQVPPSNARDGWERIGTTDLYLRWLSS